LFGISLSRSQAVRKDALADDNSADNTHSDTDKQPDNERNSRHFVSLPGRWKKVEKNM